MQLGGAQNAGNLQQAQRRLLEEGQQGHVSKAHVCVCVSVFYLFTVCETVCVCVWHLLVEDRGVRQDFIQAEGLLVAYSVQRRCTETDRGTEGAENSHAEI